jgi:hypothetical protein
VAFRKRSIVESIVWRGTSLRVGLAGDEAARKHVESASIASVKNVVNNAKKEARSRKDNVMV